jgi:hypothetical protein
VFDRTTTYFEIESEDEDDLRVSGNSKDERPDRPQVLIGMAVTKEGIPGPRFAAGTLRTTLRIRRSSARSKTTSGSGAFTA